jgi:hypothetical protein
MKLRILGSISCLSLLFLTTSTVHASTMYAYNTWSYTDVYTISSGAQESNNFEQSGPSSYSISGVDTLSGQTLSYSGQAQAGDGVLHAEAQFGCVSCTTIGAGISMDAAWGAGGVRATSINQGSLSDIASYAVTWNLDGTVSTFDDSGEYAFLGVSITQDGTSTGYTGATFYTSPLGPTTFYLQPPVAGQPFSFIFWLDTLATTNPLDMVSGETNFYNTATLESVEALDANGNVIPGVSWELSDGTLIGQNGVVSVGSTPEPTTFTLLGTGLIGLAAIKGRKQILH